MTEESTINRRLREMSEEDAKKLENLIEHHDEIEDLLKHRESYSIVSKRIKVIAAWITGVGAAFFFLHEKIIEVIRNIVQSGGGV